MKTFNQKFSAALAIMIAGTAGFVSMLTGSLVITALTRAFMAGVIAFVFGKILAMTIFQGYIPEVQKHSPTVDKTGAENSQ